MTTTTGWNIPADPIAPQRRNPYDAPELATTPDPAPADQHADDPTTGPITEQDAESAARPSHDRRTNPATSWWTDMREDTDARKTRGGGRWWLMRWMREQPTSPADYIGYILNQREERPGGRRGWGLRTASPLVDGIHAALYITYGMTIGLALTLAAYALGWMAQRPGRFTLLALAIWVVRINLTTWLAGH